MTTMKQLTDKLATEGGCIVASADCDTIELADARARGDFTVDEAACRWRDRDVLCTQRPGSDDFRGLEA